MYRFASIAAALVFLSGCAHQQPNDYEKLANARTLTCANAEDCRLYWARATSWINQHSKTPITVASDSVIQTAMAPSEVLWSYRISREPTQGGQGSERFSVKAICNNSFGCHEPADRVELQLKTYMERGI